MHCDHTYHFTYANTGGMTTKLKYDLEMSAQNGFASLPLCYIPKASDVLKNISDSCRV